jgi:hypothetical protein
MDQALNVARRREGPTCTHRSLILHISHRALLTPVKFFRNLDVRRGQISLLRELRRRATDHQYLLFEFSLGHICELIDSEFHIITTNPLTRHLLN